MYSAQNLHNARAHEQRWSPRVLLVRLGPHEAGDCVPRAHKSAPRPLNQTIPPTKIRQISSVYDIYNKLKKKKRTFETQHKSQRTILEGKPTKRNFHTRHTLRFLLAEKLIIHHVVVPRHTLRTLFLRPATQFQSAHWLDVLWVTLSIFALLSCWITGNRKCPRSV